MTCRHPEACKKTSGRGMFCNSCSQILARERDPGMGCWGADQVGPVQARLLDMLATGKWVHGAKLRQATGIDKSLVWHAINRLRARGFQIEGHHAGQASRGYRLTFDPRNTPAARHGVALSDEVQRAPAAL